MYPFPPAENLSFLIDGDATLDTITFARFQAHFAFENGKAITWTGLISFTDALGVATRYEGPWSTQGPSTIHALLGKRVTKLKTEALLLTLVFETGELLSFETTDDRYEVGFVYHAPNDFEIF